VTEQGEGMEADDLLCSRNARSRTPLVGHAQCETEQATLMEKEAKGSEYLICLAGVESLGNRLGELSVVVQVAAADLIDDVPINGLIAMDGNVSESDRFCPTLLSAGLMS
jgi:hypothetical protein